MDFVNKVYSENEPVNLNGNTIRTLYGEHGTFIIDAVSSNGEIEHIEVNY